MKRLVLGFVPAGVAAAAMGRRTPAKLPMRPEADDETTLIGGLILGGGGDTLPGKW